MKFSVDLTPEWIPCRVLDANGLEIKDVISGDTESGEVTVLERNAEGYFYQDWTRRCGEAKRRQEKHAAPLTLIKL